MNQKPLKFIILILIVLQKCFCGYIEFIDYQFVSALDKDILQSVRLTFKLQTKLESDDFLKIVWPFSPYDLELVVSENNFQQFPKARIYKLDDNQMSDFVGPSYYEDYFSNSNHLLTYFSFHEQGIALEENTDYMIEILFQEYLDTNFVGDPLQLYTVAGTGANALVYDQNSSFVYFGNQFQPSNLDDGIVQVIDYQPVQSLGYVMFNIQLEIDLLKLYQSVKDIYGFQYNKFENGFYLVLGFDASYVKNEIKNCNCLDFLNNINCQCYQDNLYSQQKGSLNQNNNDQESDNGLGDYYKNKMIIFEFQQDLEVLYVMQNLQKIQLSFSYQLYPENKDIEPRFIFYERISSNYKGVQEDLYMNFGQQISNVKSIDIYGFMQYSQTVNSNILCNVIMSFHHGVDSGINHLSPDIYTSSNSNPVFNNIGIRFTILQKSFYRIEKNDDFSQGHIKVGLDMKMNTVMLGTVKHNFQGFPDKSTQVYQNGDELIIDYIKSIDKDEEYFIKARYFYSNAQSTAEFVGQITVYMVYPNGDNLQFLIMNQDRTLPNRIQSENYQDDVWESNFSNTKVISVIDQDDSFNVIAQRALGSDTLTQGIGIFPGTNINQDLVFILKVPQNKFCGTNVVSGNPCYFYDSGDNRKVVLITVELEISADSMQLQQGLDIIYNNAGTFDDNCSGSNKCSRSQSLEEQGINSDGVILNHAYYVEDTNTYKLIYGCYSYDNDIVLECDMFQGGGGNQGLMLIRNVQFKESIFQGHSLLSDDMLFDFKIKFYRKNVLGEQILVSESLINGYSIIRETVLDVKGSFVNFYQNSKGDKIPSFIRISINNYTGGENTQIAVFFDQSIEIDNYQDPINPDYYPCSMFDEFRISLNYFKCQAYSQTKDGDFETNSLYVFNQYIITEPFDSNPYDNIQLFFPIKTRTSADGSIDPTHFHVLIGEKIDNDQEFKDYQNYNINQVQPVLVQTINGVSFETDNSIPVLPVNGKTYSDYNFIGTSGTEEVWPEYTASTGLSYDPVSFSRNENDLNFYTLSQPDLTNKVSSNLIGAGCIFVSVGFNMGQRIQIQDYLGSSIDSCILFRYQSTEKFSGYNLDLVARFGAFCPLKEVTDKCDFKIEFFKNFIGQENVLRVENVFPNFEGDFFLTSDMFFLGITEKLGRPLSYVEYTNSMPFDLQGESQKAIEIQQITFDYGNQSCYPDYNVFPIRFEFDLGLGGQVIPLHGFDIIGNEIDFTLEIHMKIDQIYFSQRYIQECGLIGAKNTQCYVFSGSPYYFQISHYGDEPQIVENLQFYIVVSGSYDNTSFPDGGGFIDFQDIEIRYGFKYGSPYFQQQLFISQQNLQLAINLCGEHPINTEINFGDAVVEDNWGFNQVITNLQLNFQYTDDINKYPSDFGINDKIYLSIDQNYILNNDGFFSNLSKCVVLGEGGQISHDFSEINFDFTLLKLQLNIKNTRKIMPDQFFGMSLYCKNVIFDENYSQSFVFDYQALDPIYTLIGIVNMSNPSCDITQLCTGLSNVNSFTGISIDSEPIAVSGGKILNVPGFQLNPFELFIQGISVQSSLSYLVINFNQYFSVNEDMNLSIFMGYGNSENDFQVQLFYKFVDYYELEIELPSVQGDFYLIFQGIVFDFPIQNSDIFISHKLNKDSDLLLQSQLIFDISPYHNVLFNYNLLEISEIKYNEVWLNGVSDVQIVVQFQGYYSEFVCISFVFEFPYKFEFQNKVINELQCKLYNYKNDIEIIQYCQVFNSGIVKFSLENTNHCGQVFESNSDYIFTILGLSTPSSSQYSLKPIKMYFFVDEDGSNEVLGFSYRRFSSKKSLLPQFFGSFTPPLIFRWQRLPLFSRTILDPSNFLGNEEIIQVQKGVFSGTLVLYLENEIEQDINQKYGNRFPYTFSIKTVGNEEYFGLQGIETYKQQLIGKEGQQYLFIDYGIDISNNDEFIQIQPVVYPTYGFYQNIPELNFQVLDYNIINEVTPVELVQVVPEITNIKVEIGKVSQPIRFKIDKSYLIHKNSPQSYFYLNPSENLIEFIFGDQIQDYYQFQYEEKFNPVNEFIGIQLEIENDESLIGNIYELQIISGNWFYSTENVVIEIVDSVENSSSNKVEVLGVNNNSVVLQTQCSEGDKQTFYKYHLKIKNQKQNVFESLEEIDSQSEYGIKIQTIPLNDDSQKSIFGGLACQEIAQTYNITQLNPGTSYIMRLYDYYDNDQVKILEFKTEGLAFSPLVVLQIKSKYIMVEEELSELLVINVDRIIMEQKQKGNYKIKDINGDQQVNLVDEDDILEYNESIEASNSIFIINYYISPDKYAEGNDDTINSLQRQISQQSEIYNEFNRITGNELVFIGIQSYHEPKIDEENLPYVVPTVSYVNDNEGVIVKGTINGGDGLVSICVLKKQYKFDQGEEIDFDDILQDDDDEDEQKCFVDQLMTKDSSYDVETMQFSKDDFQEYFYIYVRTTEVSYQADRQIYQNEEFTRVYVYTQEPNYIVLYVSIPIGCAIILAIIIIVYRSHKISKKKKVQNLQDQIKRNNTYEDFTELENKSSRTIDDKLAQQQDQGFLKNPYNKNRQLVVKQMVLQDGKIVEKKKNLKGKQLKILGDELAREDVDEIMDM